MTSLSENKVNELIKECLKIVDAPLTKCIKKIKKENLMPVPELNLTTSILSFYIVKYFEELKIYKYSSPGEVEQVITEFCKNILDLIVDSKRKLTAENLGEQK